MIFHRKAAYKSLSALKKGGRKTYLRAGSEKPARLFLEHTAKVENYVIFRIGVFAGGNDEIGFDFIIGKQQNFGFGSNIKLFHDSKFLPFSITLRENR